MSKNEEIPIIDLENPVSAEQFTTAMTAINRVAGEIARDRNWCGAWTERLRMISPVFPQRDSYSGRQSGTVNITRVTSETLPEKWVNMLTDEGKAEYAASIGNAYRDHLVLVRRRILGEVAKGQISLENANRGFAAAGLPQYTRPAVTRYDLYPPAVSVTVPEGMTREQLETAVNTAYRVMLREQLGEGVTLREGYKEDRQLRVQTREHGSGVVAEGDYEAV
jgi:hypothetical protein